MRRDVCAAILIFGLLGSAVLSLPQQTPQAATNAAQPTFTIVVTGDTRAALEDCG